MKKLIHVAGARPNFVKIASIIKACQARPELDNLLVHTGQHYSPQMSDSFFCDLGIPQPDINLEVGSGSHAQQTAEIMKRFEPVLLEHQPDAVLVVGDVNSTVACVLTAVKLGIQTIHVEAGLRSHDRTMPEEINRVVTDAISDILFVTEQSGLDNLVREGVAREKIHLVGNVMIDTLLQNRAKADQSRIRETLGLTQGEFAVITMHRPSNVDNHQVFGRILDAFEVIQRDMKMVFPVHPRTLKNMQSNGLYARIKSLPNFVLAEPLGYLDFLKLMADASIIITDSGGIQEESTILGIPCLTVRENTERPVTITSGTNQLVGVQPENILAGYRKARAGEIPARVPPLWDGKAAERIARILADMPDRHVAKG